MATYDLTQTVFLFNFLSNAASNVTGTAPELAQFLGMAVDQGGLWADPKSKRNLVINGFLQNMNPSLQGGDWRLVWGPGVFQESGDQAQNALFVVRSDALDTYVVAMAGTNPHSVYDWLVEDDSVGPDDMAEFPVSVGEFKPGKVTADLSKVQVSHGTAIGIYNLLTGLVDANGHALDLMGFLTGPDINPGAKMVFTGHSLGGALSATLAYQVYSDRNNKCTVQALPTAGPSPGNGLFADAWGAMFPPAEVQRVNDGNQVSHLNQLVYNNQDMVPHAWDFILSDTNQLANGQYPNLDMPCFFYDHEGPIDAKVETQLGALLGDWIDDLWAKIKGAQDRGTQAGMTRVAKNIGLTGTFPLTYWSGDTVEWAQWSPPSDNHFTTLEDFATGLGLVHVWQYHQFFGIDPRDIVRAIKPELYDGVANSPA